MPHHALSPFVSWQIRVSCDSKNPYLGSCETSATIVRIVTLDFRKGSDANLRALAFEFGNLKYRIVS